MRGNNIILIKDKIETKKKRSKTLKEKSIEELVLKAAYAAEDKKGKNITIIDVRKLTVISDYFLIISVSSTVQAQAIGKYIEATLKEENYRLISREGFTHGAWLVLDYGDIVIHIMMEDERKYYKLESFWSNGKYIDFEKSKKQKRAS